MIYMIYTFYLFIYLFIYFFIYLFIYLFIYYNSLPGYLFNCTFDVEKPTDHEYEYLLFGFVESTLIS